MKLVLMMFFILINSFPDKLFAQSIHQNWISPETKSCIEFDSITGRLNIKDYYDNYKKRKQRFEYKIKGKQLKVNWYHDEKFYGFKKETIWLTINKLQNKELSLTIIPSRQERKSGFIDLLGDSTVNFKQTEIGCTTFYKSNVIK
jgi:hypothetical protein